MVLLLRSEPVCDTVEPLIEPRQTQTPPPSVSLPVEALLTLRGRNGEAKAKQMNGGQNNRRREQTEHFRGLREEQAVDSKPQ